MLWYTNNCIALARHQGMHLTPAPSQRMAKSNSLSVLEHDTDMHIVDQDDIIGLTQDVKNFSDGLARLKGLFTEQCGMYICCSSEI